jgi:hypothetical protein
LSKNLIVFKTHKKSYTESLCITDPEYVPNNQYIWSFGEFYRRLAIFGRTVTSPMDFEGKFEKF